MTTPATPPPGIAEAAQAILADAKVTGEFIGSREQTALHDAYQRGVTTERERCAQLAEKHHVQVILPGGTLGTGRRVPFADLLRQDGGT